MILSCRHGSQSTKGISAGCQYGAIIGELVSVTLGSKTSMKFNPYLYKAFETSVAHKREIKINTSYIRHDIKDEELREIFFYSFVNVYGSDIDGWYTKFD